MSFADKVKDELLEIKASSDSEKRAFILGAIRAIGTLDIKKTGVSLVFSSNNYALIMTLADYIKSLYRVEVSVSRSGQAEDKKGYVFTLNVPSTRAKQILEDTKLAKIVDDEIVGFIGGFDDDIYKDESSLKMLVRALFISVGSVYVPDKINAESDELTNKSEGYRLEFVFEDETLANDVKDLLQFLSNKIKVIERQLNFVVYAKESEKICDIFAWLGANNAVLELNDIMIEREVLNGVNRMNNCSIANIDKAVNAGLKQVKAIEYIQSTIGLNKLADNLREIALLRISKPSASLVELEEILDHKITKSGINHRLRKIVEIAEELKKNEGK